MKKTLFLLFGFIAYTHLAMAQCGPIMVNATTPQYPDTNTNLPSATIGLSYQSVVQFYCSTTLGGFPVSNIVINGISGLPNSFTSTTSPVNGVLSAGNSGCIIIQSSNVSSNPGVFPIIINASVFMQSGGSTQFQIIGYKIVVQQPGNSGSALTGNYNYSNFSNTKVGSTLNNQQTNGSSYRRVQILPNNNVGVTWATSNDASPFIGRGTGYNRFNGNNWIKQDTTSTRIESQRSGFPSYAFNPTTNEEIVLSHIVTSNGYAGGFVLSRKNVAATTWNQSTVLDTIATVPGLLWCRTAVSNNYLHVVACYADSSQNQPHRVVRNGVRTPVVYSRLNLSTNIWEVKTVTLPNYNSTRYYNGISDSYSIDAGGNNVAILIGCAGQDLSLWKSGNNGTSWSKTIIDTFYQSPFIESSTIIDPAILSTDNHLHVLLDNSGTSHCFWTQLAFHNPDITDGAWNYFPSNSNQQLKYWKEGTSLTNRSTIATFNGDPISVTNWGIFANGINSRYGTSYYIANPNAGISSDGKIYCIYSSPTEGESNIGTRDLYAIYSSNSGQTWSNPKNLTAVLGSALEQAFPSIARTVNNKIHIVYSQSGSVGPNSAGQWAINYYAIDTGLLDTNDTIVNNQSVSFSLSDTILCKGKVLNYSINNAKLYVNDTLIATGIVSGSFTPNSNKNIKIKSLDGLVVFKNINIIITDSLNLQSIFDGSNLNSGQVSICGTNKTFQLGVSSNYAGTKNVVWKLNSSTLFGRNNMIDTFSQGGTYEVTIQTPSGCRSSKEVLINKNNSSFNVDFTVDRQIASAPPFNFIFTNQTPQLINFDFYWNWGDGKIDTSNSQILIPKTYLNNGLYTVKLTSQHKQTGCKDSITKVNYISCSGSNPQPLSLTTIKINPSCFGSNNGSITVNANGGTTPYQYRINNGTYQSSNTFSNLTSGVYSVQVKDASNTSVSMTDTLTDPALLIVGGIIGNNGVPVGSTQAYSITAQTGVIYTWNIINGTLLSGNGTNSISVQWASVAGGGKVIAIISRSGCSAADTLNVSIGSSPLTFTTAITNETCPGKVNGSIVYTASGGNSPYQYSINNGAFQTSNTINNLSAGVYLSKVKDAMNIVVQRYDTVKAGIGITVGAMNGPTSVATGALSSYIVGQQTGFTYDWSVTNGLIANGQGSNMAQVSWGSTSGQGVVKVKATSSAGCVDSTLLNVTIGSTGVSDASQVVKFNIYPNPVANKITIDFPSYNQQGERYIIKIANIVGQIIHESSLQGHITSIDASAFSTGVHILTIYDGNNKLISTNKVSIIK